MRRSLLFAAAVPGLGSALLLWLAMASCAGAVGAPESPQPVERVEAAERSLAERLERVIQSPALKRSRVSALVVRESDGHVLFEHRADRPMTPASNMKILTAMAALDIFGPSHRFETVALAPAPPDGQGAVATLFVRGGGDPVLNSEDWWRFAADLALRGVRRVTGDLVMDDSLFDDERWHPSWGRTSSRAYHAPVGALTANYGSFGVRVAPGARRGDPVRVVVDPPVPYLQLASKAVTSISKTDLVVDRAAGEGVEVITVAGSLAAGAEAKTYYRSVLDPTRYAGAVLRRQLEALGIQVDGVVRRGLAPSADEAHELLAFKGRPLADIVRLFVKFSNNAIAETLVKQIGVATLGGTGSWRAGMPALRARLEQMGLLGEGSVLIDGSGLSYANRVSPRSLVGALRLAAASFRFGPELVSALPIAAADGTLEERAKASAGEVRAKTGLLNGVTSLSGFARRRNGERVVFSLMVNGYRVTDDIALQAVDRFAEELVRAERDPRPAAMLD